jgi:hypothetical protein
MLDFRLLDSSVTWARKLRVRIDAVGVRPSRVRLNRNFRERRRTSDRTKINLRNHLRRGTVLPLEGRDVIASELIEGDSFASHQLLHSWVDQTCTAFAI